MRILTGSTGTSHITAADDGALYAGLAGKGSYVLNLGQQFRASIQSATSIKLEDGDGILQGRHFRTDPGDSDLVAIEENSAETNRNDIIGVKYSTVSGIESMAWQVVKGAAVSGTASDPTYSEGDLLTGSTAAFMPMYRVRLEGAAIAAVEPLFTVLPALTELAKKSDAVSMSQVEGKISALQIGGENLYTGSRDFTGGVWNNMANWTKQSDKYNGLTVYARSSAWNGLSQTVGVKSGEVYTLSAWMRAGSGADVRFVCKDSDGASMSGQNNQKLTIGTDWARYSVTFTITATGQMYARFENAKAVSLHICGLKLERGEKATDWSVAPHDFSAPALVDMIYPVGSIYMSVNSASPATLFGGTWEQIKDTFLLSAGDTYAAGATGGEAEHALTAAELPDHAHHAYGYTTGESDWAFLNVKRDGHQKTQVATSSSSGRYVVTGASTANVDNPYFTKEDEAELEGAAHNNMPPYLAVYVWKRTA